MNVVFWSTAQGKCGTTHNMMAVALTASLLYPMKSVLIHTGTDSFVWEKNYSLKRGRLYNKERYARGGAGPRGLGILSEDFSYYGAAGLDDIIESSRLKNVSENMIYENMLKISSTSFYIPSSRRIGTGIRSDEAAMKMPDIMKRLDSLSDICFIDAKTGKDKVSWSILDAADIIVINICQNCFSMDEYGQIPQSVRNKSIYVIGRYDDNSKSGIDDIRKKFKIDKDKLGAIPYSILYSDAINAGSAVGFLEKSIQAGKSGRSPFMDGVCKTVGMVLKKAGYNV